MGQRETIWALETANRRTFRAFQLKEELRGIVALGLIQARAALDSWLAYAFRSKPAPFVKLARTIRRYRASVEPTIGWRLPTGSPSPTTPPSAGSAPTPESSMTPKRSSP